MTEKTFTCSICGSEKNWLEEFPGRKCLECYAKEQESKPLPTAKELADMFRNPKLINL